MAGARGVALLAIGLLLACVPAASARTVFDVGPAPQYGDWRVVDGGLVQTDVEFEGPFDVTFHAQARPRARADPAHRSGAPAYSA
jgi:hypothetical protein